MRLTRSLLYLLLALLTVAVGVATNVATDQMPPWIQPHLWLSWPILGVLAILFVVLSVLQARTEKLREEPSEPTRPSEPLVVKVEWPGEPKEKPKPPIPEPPTPYFVHPYPMQPNFTGRVHERRMLTAWLTSGQEPVLALVALGGMGKSALAWAWLLRDVLGLPLPGELPSQGKGLGVRVDTRPEGVFWWSFYEREARFAKFLDEALTYTSGGRVNPADVPSAYDKVRCLVNLLQQRRFLLVLDGFERELCAYASLNAAYQGDAVAADAQGDFRTCTDPHAADFLRWVAAGPLQSRVLLTSRLFPRALDGCAGCRHEELTSLDPDDAVVFFHAQEVRGNRAEIQAACAPYGYLPLALRLLSGLILWDKRQPGDVQVASRHPVLPKLQGKEQHHILQVAYDELGRQKRELLSRLAAFRSPMSYAALAIFNTYKSDQEFDAALDELLDRGLLLFDKERGRYDLHPIVRGYAYDRLADKAGVHTRLRDYFAAVPTPEEDKVQSVEDLALTIELYHHTVRAGRYEEAWNLYYGRLYRLLYFRFGAYQAEIELLESLLPDGESLSISTGHLRRNTWWILNQLANSYSNTGQLRRAVLMFETSIEMIEGKFREDGLDRYSSVEVLEIAGWGDQVRPLAGLLGNLAHMAQLRLGKLEQLGVNPSVVIRSNLTHKTSPGNHRRISASVY